MAGHKSASEIERFLSDLHPGVKWTGITVLRNPYERYLSAYDFGFHVAKLLIEHRHDKIAASIKDVNKTWVEFGRMTPHLLLVEWMRYQTGTKIVDFKTDLPFLIPTLQTQSSFLLSTTKRFNLESLKHLRTYFQDLTGCQDLPEFEKLNPTTLTYARSQGLDSATIALIQSFYSTDFAFGKYSKEVINCKVL